MRKPYRWLERLGVVLLGLLLSLLLLEGGLRIAALFVGQRPAAPAVDAQRPILALGDSHTYGISLSEDEAYPGQLQTELDRRAPGRFRVINLGLPGMNSSQIRANLPGWLDRYQPQIVVICAGVNNFWNKSETDTLNLPQASANWISSLRVYRLLQILMLRLRAPDPNTDVSTHRPDIERFIDGETREHRDRQTGEIIIRHQGNPLEPLETTQAINLLRRDLAQIHAVTRARGVRLILLTYAEIQYPRMISISNAIRTFGQENGLDVVDPRERFRELLEDGADRSIYFLNKTDAHPNARGYTEIAESVADAIEPRP